jgi:UDP-N-acetyl-D-mannosaminuronic acid transferase (WecB/TagA/CpsF family)
VKQEPRRLWKRYLVTNVLFALMLARELVAPIPAAEADASRS